MLGEKFGTAYDLSTIAILWFAGASAMAGLLNLVPKYLPRYGMAPEWAKATRPLVLLFTGITFLITYLFRADVEAQGGAYATGVLVLMTSAAVAVTLAAFHRGSRARLAYAAITLVFVYTTVANVIERPDGVKIASWFIVTIIVTSMISRVLRSTELRIKGVEPDAKARQFIREAAGAPVRIIANRPDTGRPEEYAHKLKEARESHHLPPDEHVLFMEVRPGDVSEFTDTLQVEGVDVGGHHVLRYHEPGHPERHRGASAVLPRRDGQDPARLFRLDRGQPDRLPAQVPRLRRRGHGAGHARSAAPDRAQPDAAPAHSRRVGLRAQGSGLKAQVKPQPPHASSSRRRLRPRRGPGRPSPRSTAAPSARCRRSAAGGRAA